MAIFCFIKTILFISYMMEIGQPLVLSSDLNPDHKQNIRWSYVFITFIILIVFVLVTMLCFEVKHTEKHRYNSHEKAKKKRLSNKNKSFKLCTVYESDDSSSYVSSEWEIQSNDTEVGVAINEMDYRVPLSLITPNRIAWEWERDGRKEMRVKGNTSAFKRSSSYPFFCELHSKSIPRNERHPYSCFPVDDRTSKPTPVVKISKETQTPHIFTLPDHICPLGKISEPVKAKTTCPHVDSKKYQHIRQSVPKQINPTVYPPICQPVCALTVSKKHQTTDATICSTIASISQTTKQPGEGKTASNTRCTFGISTTVPVHQSKSCGNIGSGSNDSQETELHCIIYQSSSSEGNINLPNKLSKYIPQQKVYGEITPEMFTKENDISVTSNDFSKLEMKKNLDIHLVTEGTFSKMITKRNERMEKRDEVPTLGWGSSLHQTISKINLSPISNITPFKQVANVNENKPMSTNYQVQGDYKESFDDNFKGNFTSNVNEAINRSQSKHPSLDSTYVSDHKDLENASEVSFSRQRSTIQISNIVNERDEKYKKNVSYQQFPMPVAVNDDEASVFSCLDFTDSVSYLSPSRTSFIPSFQSGVNDLEPKSFVLPINNKIDSTTYNMDRKIAVHVVSSSEGGRKEVKLDYPPKVNKEYFI